MKIDFSKRFVSFYENNGIKLYNKFNALNTKMKPVDLYIKDKGKFHAIMIDDAEGENLGTFEVVFKKNQSTIEGQQLISYTEREGNGQLLTLASIMELAQNRMNKLTYFAGDTKNIPFLAKFGFVLENDDARYLINGLKQIIRSKIPNIEEFKYKSRYLHSRLDMLGDVVPDDKSLFHSGCQVLSDYIKFLVRHNYPKKYYPYLEVGSDMKFTDWELVTNKRYLDKLMDVHYLDYKF